MSKTGDPLERECPVGVKNIVETNFMEYFNDTNPLVFDSDGDTMPDGWEVVFELDPLRPSDNFEDKENVAVYLGLLGIII